MMLSTLITLLEVKSDEILILYMDGLTLIGNVSDIYKYLVFKENH